MTRAVARYETFSRGSGEGFPIGKVFSVFVDRERNLWVGGENGVVKRPAGGTAFDRVLGMFGDAELGETPPVWSIFQDREGRIWVGSDVTGAGITTALPTAFAESPASRAAIP